VITLRTPDEVSRGCADARGQGRSVGLVPTMGGFHEGHRSLMRAARADTDLVVVSLFVNPTQFGADEDLATYPRDPDGDAATAAAEGVDALFAPSVAAMYPDSPRTTVHVDGLTARCCGASRPTHFDGVATVVTKLLSVVGPCRAYFGRKDAQQLAVVRRLVADLNLPATIVDRPLVRDADGLALSSRNAALDADQRAAATVLHRGLTRAGEALEAGERDPSALRDLAAATIAAEPAARLDYAELVEEATFEPATAVRGELVLAVAAWVGGTHLIDNLQISATDAGVQLDDGVIAEEQRA
jgi:pantoate--beta-alanine ligase